MINVFQNKVRKKNFWKKVVCFIVSASVLILYNPLCSYALSESKKLDNREGIIFVEEIKPGQIFTSGVYEIEDSIDVVQKKPGENGIEIQGDVKFVLKNVHVYIRAGHAKGILGGGAGVYVPKGSRFTLEGQGRFTVYGGDASYGEAGHNGGNAELFEHSWWEYDEIKDGDGGAGGNGGGGAGAAIGTPGGNGGLGGKRIEGRTHWVSRFSPEEKGYDGEDGANGAASLPAGEFVLCKNVKLIANEGETCDCEIQGGDYGKDITFQDFMGKGKFYTCLGGSGGGAGGSGYAAAKIGSGGNGGAGGGSGGTGSWDRASNETSIFKANGGGGGAGQGKSSVYCCSEGGKAEYNCSYYQDPAANGGKSNSEYPGKGGEGGTTYSPGTGGLVLGQGGTGGTGGKAIPSGSGGVFYCDKGNMNLTSGDSESKYDGKNASCRNIIRQSNHEIKFKGKKQENNFATAKEVSKKHMGSTPSSMIWKEYVRWRLEYVI